MLTALDEQGQKLLARQVCAAHRTAPEMPKTTAFCDECRSRLVLRCGRIRASHFAHPANSHCARANGKSIEHLTAIEAISLLLEASNQGSEVVRRIALDESVGNYPETIRRPDILLVCEDSAGQEQRLVLEYQRTEMDVRDLHRRTVGHVELRNAVLWITRLPPAKEGIEPVDLGDGVRVLFLPRTRLDKWKQWIVSLSGNRGAWFYDEKAKALYRGYARRAWSWRSNDSMETQHGYVGEFHGWVPLTDTHHLVLARVEARHLVVGGAQPFKPQQPERRSLRFDFPCGSEPRFPRAERLAKETLRRFAASITKEGRDAADDAMFSEWLDAVLKEQSSTRQQ